MAWLAARRRLPGGQFSRGADPHVVVHAGALQHHELAWPAVQSMNVVRTAVIGGTAQRSPAFSTWCFVARASFHHQRTFQAGQAAAGAVMRAGGAGVAVASLAVTSKDPTVKPW